MGKSLSCILFITMLYKKNFHRHLTSIAVTDPVEGASLIFFRLNWDPKGGKKNFEILPHLWVWMTGPPYLKVWTQIWMAFHSTEVTLSFRRRGLLLKNYPLLAAYHGPLLYSDLGHLIIEAQKDGLIFSTCFWFIWWQRDSQTYKRRRTETSLHKANVIPVWLFGT